MISESVSHSSRGQSRAQVSIGDSGLPAAPLSRIKLVSGESLKRSAPIATDDPRSKSKTDHFVCDASPLFKSYKPETLTLRDKVERFWRNNAANLIAGAITGAGVGLTIGGISGLMATAGTFSVPLAIVGAVVGAPIGAALFVLAPRLLYSANAERYGPGPRPLQTHAEKQETSSRENGALSQATNNAFSRNGQDATEAKDWQKQLCSWIEKPANFAFWNLTTPPKGGNIVDALQYQISKGLTRGIPFFKAKSRDGGYARIEQYKQYLAEVLSQEKDAMLDISRIVPGPIKSLPPGLLKGFSNIEQLAVNGSVSATTLPSHMLDGLTNLKDLSISGNRYDDDEFVDSGYKSLKTLPPDFFDSVPQLETLLLSGNDLTSLPGGVFKNLTNLKSLDLSGNEKLHLTKELAQGLTHLEELNLSGMELRQIPNEFLENLPNLKRLDISGNKLSRLPEDAFKGLDKLEEINIEGNGLQALPKALPENLANLKAVRLNLAEDPIETIPDGFARLLVNSPGCFPDFDGRYADSFDPEKLVSYVESGRKEERVDRLRLLYMPGVVERKMGSFDLSGFKTLTSLPDLGAWHVKSLNLSNNENLEFLPDSIVADRLVLNNCGPKRPGSSVGSLEAMANAAKQKLGEARPLGIADRTLLDSDGVLTVYGSVDLQEYDRSGMPPAVLKSLDREKHDPTAELPENFRVIGSVSVAGRSRLTIPNGVVIHGDLSLKHTNVEEFPEDLQVMGKIYIDKAYREKLSGNLQELPEHLRGKVEVRG